MIDLREKGKEWAARIGLAPEYCGVVGCNAFGAEVVELDPLDPIDHGSTFIQLCPSHQEWAEERNKLAEAVADELRECRKKIGQRRIGEIQQLATPQDGELREDILMGEAEGKIPLGDAHEDDEPSLVGGDGL